MSERARDILVVVSLVVVLLAAFAGLLALRRGRPGAGPGAGPSVVPAVPERPGPAPLDPGRTDAGPTPPVPSGSGADSGKGEAAAAPTGPGAPAADGASAVGTAWQKRAPAEFTAEDVAQCGRGVTLDLGSYEVRAGEEFEVKVRLTAPPLESLTLRLQFDSEVVSLVPDSTAPVGPQFRSGIECYAGRDGRSMALIHAGAPGKKNLDAGTGSPAVTWRMRAVRPGTARLEVAPQSSFTNARGEDEQYSVSGGDVNVR